MATNTKSKVDYEANQSPFPFTQCTQDQVDLTTFVSGFAPWSLRSGNEPVVGPYGLINGGTIVPDAGLVDDTIDISASRLMMPGATGADINTGEIQVGAGSLVITRPTINTHHIASVTVDSTGTLVAIDGAEGLSWDTTGARGGNGQPPEIPVGSVELGWVLIDQQASAPISSGAISQVEGLSTETTFYPVYEQDYTNGNVVFAQAPANIHTGGVPKEVWVRGSTPVFTEQTRCSDFTPAENTHSVSSIQTFDTTIGSVSSSVGQGSFTTYMRDGIGDPLARLQDETLWFRFYQDRNSGNHILTNGVFGMSRPYTAGEQVVCNCTISAEEPSDNVIA